MRSSASASSCSTASMWPVPERMRGPLERTCVSATEKHLLGLINDVLDHCPEDRGGPAISFRRRIFGRRRIGAWCLWRGRTARRGKEPPRSLSTIVPPGLPPARAETSAGSPRLSSNLVGNAIKFTDLWREVAIEVAARGDLSRSPSAIPAPASPKRIKPKSSRNSGRWTVQSPRPRWVRVWVLQSQSASSRCTVVAFGSIPAQARGRHSHSRPRRGSSDRRRGNEQDHTRR